MITNIITATITAYCACKICCGPNAKGITASNEKPKEGRTIAVPRSYSLRSTSVIINNHIYRAEDRTSKNYDGRFDIFMSSHARAKEFGIKTQQVIIITP